MLAPTLMIISSLIQSAFGHGRLAVPTPRDTIAGATTSTQNAPIGWNYDFGCRGYPLGTSQMTLTAGQNVTTQWIFTALHPGDCFFYLSYDISKTEAQQAWFKIAEIPQCNLLSGVNYQVTIPYWVPSGQAILRWEWYALHLVTTVEFYSQCVDITINGNSQGVIGTPLAYVPFHLPQNNSNLLNYRNPYDTNSAFFLTGPAIAVPSSFVASPTSSPSGSGSGSSAGSGSSSGSSSSSTSSPGSSSTPESSGSSSNGGSSTKGVSSGSSGSSALGIIGGLSACGMLAAGGILLRRRYARSQGGSRGLIAQQQQPQDDPYRLIGDDTHADRISAPSSARPSWPQQQNLPRYA